MAKRRFGKSRRKDRAILVKAEEPYRWWDELLAAARREAAGDRMLRETLPHLYTPEVIKRTGWRDRKDSCGGYLQMCFPGATSNQIKRAIAIAFS